MSLPDPKALTNDRLRRLATYASVTVATILIASKLAAYLLTDSVAMLSSLADSTVDLIASMVTMFGVASAMQPPDHDHRFGHGKAEPLAALAQAAFIIGSSILLSYEALGRLYQEHTVKHMNTGYAVMAVAIVLTAILLEFQRFVVNRTNSMAIGADRLHYVGDLFINTAVMVSFALQQWTGFPWLDPLFAVVIAVVLIVSACRIARNALNVLMDRELPETDRARVIALVEAQAGVIGIHDLRTRTDSDRVFIDFHLELDPDITMRAAHAITQGVVDCLEREFPLADVMVRQDPAGIEETRRDSLIAAQKTAKAD